MNLQRYRFVWLLAKRDVLEDRKISLIVIAMLGFSFLNLTFFPAFINGLSDSFTADIIETQTGHVSIHAEEGRVQNAASIVDRVERLDAVRSVEKRLEFSAAVTYKDTTVQVPVIGTSAYEDAAYTSRMRTGRFLSRDDTGRVVLGETIAQSGQDFGVEGLGVTIGRSVTMTVAGNGATRTFRVQGIVGRPGPSQLPRQGFIAYADAEALLDAPGEADAVKILLEDQEQADMVKQRLQQLNVGGDIRTWQEESDVADAISSTFSIVIATVSLVGIIIALTSVGVVIFINTNKRAREMGVVRSLGAESATVIQIFVLEAFLFGVIGVALGNLFMLGIHAALTANPLQTPIGPLTTVVTTDLLVTRTLWMLLAAVGAGFLPAYLLSKRSIISAIETR